MAACDLSSLRGFFGYLSGDLWHDLRTHQEALKQAVSTAAQAAALECAALVGETCCPLELKSRQGSWKRSASERTVVLVAVG